MDSLSLDLLSKGRGRRESWALCGTQAHTPLVSGEGGPQWASGTSEEAQALLVLRHWQEMPGFGIQLVPEHVETRPLYHPHSPGLLQVRGVSSPQTQDSQNPRIPTDSGLWPWHTLSLKLPLGPDVTCQHPHIVLESWTCMLGPLTLFLNW